MKYSIILSDPPWLYRDGAHAGQRGAEYQYPCMSLAELQAMRPFIDSLAAPNCALFLWATSPMLIEAIRVIHAWGFVYTTVAFVWAKRNKKSPTWFTGMGSYTRANAELCLLALRGKLERRSASVRQIIEAPIREHSRKPDEVRERIVQLYGDLPRIELFARERVQGWAGHGLEYPQE